MSYCYECSKPITLHAVLCRSCYRLDQEPITPIRHNIAEILHRRSYYWVVELPPPAVCILELP